MSMQQYADVVTDLAGNALSGASVSIFNLDGSLASLFADDGVTPLANPVPTDASGSFVFRAADGRYTRAVTFGGMTFAAPGEIVLSMPVDLNSIKSYGGVGNGVTDNLAAGTAAYAASADVYYPDGTFLFSTKPAGFNSKRRSGPGIVTLQDMGDVYPDSDILRYDPNANGGDYSIRLTRNRADLNTDPAKTGFYFYQNYTSSRATSSLFGYAANIKRSGGGAKVVPVQANGYAIDGGTQSVWGIATEAWTGDATTEGTGSSSLIAGEFAVHSQYHANTSSVIGSDHVFYNKRGSGGDVLHGSAGLNQFNKNSKAIQISTGFNEGRPASGAYNGWNTGIYFGSNSLDISVDRKAYGIDMGDVQASRMLAALRIPNGVPISMGKVTAGGGIEDGFVYVDDGSRRRIEIRRDVLGAAPVTALTLDLSSTGPLGTVMAFDNTYTTVGAAGAAAATPASPALYARIRIAGVNYKIPLYTV